METVQSPNDIVMLEDNSVSAEKLLMNNSIIQFTGVNNRLIIEDSVNIHNSKIIFNGSNGSAYISFSPKQLKINLTINNNCSFYLGKNYYFNGVLNAIISEQTKIIIGDSCLFSFGIWIRTADPHLIYDLDSEERVNPSRSVLIGDHVWIGQNALILKNSQIGSGTILGANSVLSSKHIESNSIWGGNPVKRIKRRVFWSGECVHTWTTLQTQKHSTMQGKDYNFIPEQISQENRAIDVDSLSVFNMPEGKYRFSIL